VLLINRKVNIRPIYLFFLLIFCGLANCAYSESLLRGAEILNDTSEKNIKSNSDSLKRFYVGLSSGYMFLGSGGGFAISRKDNMDGTRSSSPVRYTLGLGMPTRLLTGFRFNPYIALNLGVTYHYGAGISWENELIAYGTSSQGILNERFAIKSDFVFVYPGITLSYPINNLEIIARTSYTIGFGEKIIENTYNYRSSVSSENYLIESEHISRGGIAKGFISSAGLKINSRSNMSFIAEMVYNNIGATFKTRTTTKYNLNGEDALGALTTSEKEGVYTDIVVNNSDSNKPLELNRILEPFHSFGIQLGLVYSF
jgi:hypothetical protein